MNRLWVYVGAAAAAAVVSACAGEDGKAGPPGVDGAKGGSCSVSVTAGVATISCPDGTSTPLDPGACAVTSNGDGMHTITCPDGSTTTVRDGEQLPRASIKGTAGRYGMLPGDVQITLVQQDRTVDTDTAGGFAFDGLAPGLYDLRLVADGHQPRDVKNVAVFGRDVDLGALVVKVGMKIGEGPSYVEPSPSGARLAVTQVSFFGDHGVLALVDTATGERHQLDEFAGDPLFVGERYLLAEQPLGDGVENLLIYDLDSALPYELRVIERVESWTPVAGGLLYQVDGIVRHLDLATGLPTEVGTGYVTWSNWDLGLAIVRHDDGSLSYVDGADIVPLGGDWWDYRIDYATGKVALIGAALTSSFWISNGGNLLVFHTPDGLRIWDGTVVAELDLTGSFWDLWFSENQRYLLVRGEGWTVLDRTTGTTWTLPRGIGGLSQDERWAWSYENGVLAVVDLQAEPGEPVTHTVAASWGIEPVAGDALVLMDSEGNALFDISAGTSRSFGSPDGGFSISPDRSVVYFADPTTGMIEVLDVADGTVSPFPVQADHVEQAGNERWLFALRETAPQQAELTLVSVDAQTVLPIDEKVLDLDGYGAGFVYWAGEFAFLPTLFDVSADPFAGVETYWVAYP